MRPRKFIKPALLIGAALSAAGGLWLSLDDAPSTTPAPAPQAASQAQIMAWPHAINATPPLAQAATPADQGSPLLPVDASAPAHWSMADARENGDARMPPVQRSDPGEAPTAWELENPDKYRDYEARQQMRLYGEYVQAASQAAPALRNDIERGRAEGIGPEQIAKAEEKLRRIEAARVGLLEKHPQLAGQGK